MIAFFFFNVIFVLRTCSVVHFSLNLISYDYHTKGKIVKLKGSGNCCKGI